MPVARLFTVRPPAHRLPASAAVHRVLANEPTNQQTRRIAIPPGGGN